MLYLILGILIFFAVHSISILSEGWQPYGRKVGRFALKGIVRSSFPNWVYPNLLGIQIDSSKSNDTFRTNKFFSIFRYNFNAIRIPSSSSG